MAFRSSAKASSSSGGTITATPAGVAAHDYLGATYIVDSATATLSVPTGWTNQANNAWGSGAPDGQTQFYADKNDASGSDAFGFSDSSSTSPNSLICAAWSGRDNVNPFSTTLIKTLNTSSNGTPVSATINGITASASDDIAVWMGTDQTAGPNRWTFSTITNYTEQQDGVATDWVSGIALDTRDNVSSGATGNFTTTITDGLGTGFAGYAGIVVALKVAAAATDQPPQAECGDCWEASAIGEAEIHDVGPWDWYQDETCPNRAGVEPPIPERLPESFEWVDPNETDEALYIFPWGTGPPPADVDTYVYDQTIHDSSDQLEDVDEDFAFADAPLAANLAADPIPGEDSDSQLEDADEDFGFADAPRPGDVATDPIPTEDSDAQLEDEPEDFAFADAPLPDDVFDQLFNDFGHFDDPSDEPIDEGWFTAPMDVAAQPDDSSVAQECPQPPDEEDVPEGFAVAPLADDNDIARSAAYDASEQQEEDECLEAQQDAPLAASMAADQIFVECSCEQLGDEDEFGEGFVDAPLAADVVAVPAQADLAQPEDDEPTDGFADGPVPDPDDPLLGVDVAQPEEDDAAADGFADGPLAADIAPDQIGQECGAEQPPDLEEDFGFADGPLSASAVVDLNIVPAWCSENQLEDIDEDYGFDAVISQEGPDVYTADSRQRVGVKGEHVSPQRIGNSSGWVVSQLIGGKRQ